MIYAPAFYAKTDELVALCEVAAEYGGRYITHMRSEGNRLLEGVDEVLDIARRAKIGAEIYHLKAAGEDNWPKLEQVFAKIEAARAEGLDLTADMYTYTAAATGLTAAVPPPATPTTRALILALDSAFRSIVEPEMTLCAPTS